MADTSNGEQTIARAPDLTAFVAKGTASSSGECENPISLKESASREVNTVTAVISIDGAAFTADVIIAEPPEA
jgi:hypothetical protein